MKTTIKIFALASLALAACGDNKSRPDAASRRDSAPPDAPCSNCPAAPTIGTIQLDRMGRPAINTALNFAFRNDTGATPSKDAYNADNNKTNWRTAWAGEIIKNLAIIDVIDGGMTNNGLCETGETNAANPTECPTANQVGAGIGCGNQAAYDATMATSPLAYSTMAAILADDRLYLDTSKTLCAFYLAVEFGVLTTGNSTCGGRAPAYDVMDFTYSALTMGLRGFSTDGNFTPKLTDMVGPHQDLLTIFPYLGPAK